MKSRILVALSFITILVVPLAYGQESKVLASLNVEFKFMVGNKEMPAGTYEVWGVKADGKSKEQASRLLLRNYQTKISLPLTVIERLDGSSSSEWRRARFVFDKVGEKRMLSEFWPAGKADGYLLGINKGEEKHEVVQQQK